MPVRLRLPIAIVAALVIAEAAVLLMRPRGLVEPLDVAPRAYFSATQIEKAEDFRSGQLWLLGAQTALELGLLVLIVARPSRILLRPRRRQVLAGAAAAAALSVSISVVTLPVRAIARERAKDVGLVTQDWVGYAGDVVKSTAIGAVLAGAGGALLVFGMRRFGRGWWAPAAAVVVGFGVVTTYLTPIVLDPLFNKFTRLPDGPTRSAVFEMAREAGVDVGQVYVMDASRRTTAANAYVTGIGRTKRVVIYDNLLEKFSRGEVRLVLAHELGHVHYRDVPRGLLYLLIVAPFGMLAAARLGERMAPRDSLGTAAAVPAVVLAVAIMAPAITTISNQLSRGVEQRADQFSLEIAPEPRAFIGFQKRIALTNVSDPDPPALVRFLLGTHPSTMQRIGLAERFER
ncbi:MAG TPA: M48 family metalloprotease [Solirubrobacteraceae bacterium]|nr:M48 family metalloprotease [Solirubrobacteraceae bacterium]